jgi:hypothetical protein
MDFERPGSNARGMKPRGKHPRAASAEGLGPREEEGWGKTGLEKL